jgi:hypothetical protein
MQEFGSGPVSFSLWQGCSWSTPANSKGHAVFVYPQPDLNVHYTTVSL